MKKLSQKRIDVYDIGDGLTLMNVINKNENGKMHQITTYIGIEGNGFVCVGNANDLDAPGTIFSYQSYVREQQAMIPVLIDIFETNTIGIQDEVVNVDDIVETASHFRCIDQIIELANYPLSEAFIKQLHYILKSGTSDSRKTWFAVGEYKRFENEVGGSATAKPADVPGEMRNLLSRYNLSKQKTLKEIIQFHYEFEKIHPFQDGNGRVGRLIMFKECLRNGITPFIIEDDIKEFYYRGLKEWKNEQGYLMDTCLTAQDRFKAYMDYFGLEYKD